MPREQGLIIRHAGRSWVLPGDAVLEVLDRPVCHPLPWASAEVVGWLPWRQDVPVLCLQLIDAPEPAGNSTPTQASSPFALVVRTSRGPVALNATEVRSVAAQSAKVLGADASQACAGGSDAKPVDALLALEHLLQDRGFTADNLGDIVQGGALASRASRPRTVLRVLPGPSRPDHPAAQVALPAEAVLRLDRATVWQGAAPPGDGCVWIQVDDGAPELARALPGPTLDEASTADSLPFGSGWRLQLKTPAFAEGPSSLFVWDVRGLQVLDPVDANSDGDAPAPWVRTHEGAWIPVLDDLGPQAWTHFARRPAALRAVEAPGEVSARADAARPGLYLKANPISLWIPPTLVEDVMSQASLDCSPSRQAGWLRLIDLQALLGGPCLSCTELSSAWVVALTMGGRRWLLRVADARLQRRLVDPVPLPAAPRWWSALLDGLTQSAADASSPEVLWCLRSQLESSPAWWQWLAPRLIQATLGWVDPAVLENPES